MFDEPADSAMASLTEKLGNPSDDTGWQQFLPPSEVEGSENVAELGNFFETDDYLGPAWGYAVHRKMCWETLCVCLGGDSEGAAQLRGWEWNADDYEAPRMTGPKAQLAGTGVQLGSAWTELQAAYPGVTLGQAEGSSLAVDNLPWEGIFDGVAQWRMSGRWGRGGPQTGPSNILVTRLSAGEGPEPGCC